MLLDELREKLRDPDQWARVEALRILAMVEETRTLRDIEQVFKNDPEPGVRQIAQWAGRIVYAALKQQSQVATTAPREMSAAEEAFLASLVEKDHRTFGVMQGQLLAQELLDELRGGASTPRPAPPPVSPVPTIKTGQTGLLSSGKPRRPPVATRTNMTLLELLDAGLSDDFFEGLNDA
ncbi:MAG TPA: HEAT repeat domain-containing protein [Aggregatilineales bacterium]|nr:HEAT repeat domain-containing protein [Anaerolineales bacterium]HRE46404.1 HEAT repeat domain-containing protein [Aggregatilineales bacterium]